MTNQHIENAIKRLLKNSALYMVANYSGKLLQVMILPLITAYFSTSEYGYYDLVVSLSSIIYPIVTLQIAEGTFRFIFDNNDDEQKKIITTTFFFILLSLMVMIASINIGDHYLYKVLNKWNIIAYFSSYILYSFFQKIARSRSMNKHFAIAGIINVIITLSIQLYVVMLTKIRIEGLFISMTLANLISMLYLVFSIKIHNYIRINKISRKYIIEIIKYSLPLMPNSICWWLISMSNRFIIVAMIGAEANGIYAIAYKVPAIITATTGVFQLAWQESAIIESKSKYSKSFFKTVYTKYKIFIFLFAALFLPIIKVGFPKFVDNAYYEAWFYIPLILYGSIFCALASFYGAGYLSSKRTWRAFRTTAVSAMVNLLICVIFIRFIGIMASVVASLIAYIVMFALTKHDMKMLFSTTSANVVDALLIAQIVISVTVYYLLGIKYQIILFAVNCVILGFSAIQIIRKKVEADQSKNVVENI